MAFYVGCWIGDIVYFSFYFFILLFFFFFFTRMKINPALIRIKLFSWLHLMRLKLWCKMLRKPYLESLLVKWQLHLPMRVFLVTVHYTFMVKIFSKYSKYFLINLKCHCFFCFFLSIEKAYALQLRWTFTIIEEPNSNI